MKMDERVFPDPDAASRAALEELRRVMRDAVRARGRFAIALSGGHTPGRLYALWADEERQRVLTPWERVHLFWSDERYVSQDDPLSNFRMAREALTSRVPIPAANVHAMPTGAAEPAAAAAAYETELRRFFGDAPAFDLQLLGVGLEGHTASLFPGSAALEEKQRWVVAVDAPVEPRRRITMTPVILNQGRNTFFLVTGPEKRQIVGALRAENEAESSRYPVAQLGFTGRVLWFLDQFAAS